MPLIAITQKVSSTRFQSNEPRLTLFSAAATVNTWPRPPSILTAMTSRATRPPRMSSTPWITSSQMTASIPPRSVRTVTTRPSTTTTVTTPMPVMLETASASRKNTEPMPANWASTKANEA